MGEIATYKDLHAWQVGMDTVTLTYELTADFPASERFGLVSQMRRAAVSIPSNVAEGKGVMQPRWTLRCPANVQCLSPSPLIGFRNCCTECGARK